MKCCWSIVILMLFSVLSVQQTAANCERKGLSKDALDKATTMGIKLYHELEHHNPEMALVARVGSDLSRYGMTYSHMGIVRRNHPAGKWIFTHLLNQCGQPTSSLFDEGLITFFTDSPFRYQALLVIPDSELQGEISRMFARGDAKKLHEKQYSVLANPNKTVFQNSNQWILEMIAVAKSIYLPAGKRNNAQQLVYDFGYKPDYVKLGILKQLSVKLFENNVHFSDHDKTARSTGSFPFVSVRSLVKFLLDNGDVLLIKEISLEERSLDRYISPIYQVQPAIRSVKAGSKQSASAAGNASQLQFWR